MEYVIMGFLDSAGGLGALGTATAAVTDARSIDLQQQRQEQLIKDEQQQYAMNQQEMQRKKQADAELQSFYTKTMPETAKNGQMALIQAKEQEAIKLEAMGDLNRAKGLRDDARQSREDLRLMDAEKKVEEKARLDRHSAVAATYLTNPKDTDAKKELEKVMDEQNIPMTKRPITEEQWKSFATSTANLTMTAKNVFDLKEKQDEYAQNRADRLAKQEADRIAKIEKEKFEAQLKAGRENTSFLSDADVKRITKDVLSGNDMPKNLTKVDVARIESEKTKEIAGGASQEHYAKGVYAQNYAQRQTQAGQLLLTETSNMGDMKIGQTAGAFSDIQLGKGLTTGVTKYFGNKLTNTQAAEYATSSEGLGVEVAALMNGGRPPQKALIDEFKLALRPNAGDTVETTLYKRAMVINLARSALSVAPSANQTDKENKQRILQELNKFPTPKEVRQTAEQTGHTIQGLESINSRMKKISDQWQDSVGKLAKEDKKETTIGDWKVTEH